LPYLNIENLHAAYGDNLVLRGIDIAVEKGEIVSLIGPSGSGKSTLLRALVGLTKPHLGAVHLEGRLIDYSNKRSLREARDHFAIVFQQYNLFQNMTALKNVTIAPVKVKKRNSGEVGQEAKTLLAKVGLGDKLHSYPDELSGGQQQRVAIARALVNNPAVILADEPTGNLDSATSEEIMNLFTSLNRSGITILMVTHEHDVAAHAGRQITFRDGLIIGDTKG
jgi:polar amino acid transport system ATP-binding protein